MGIATSNPSGPFHRHFAKVTSVVTQRLHSTVAVAVVIAWAPVAVADAPGVREAALDKDNMGLENHENLKNCLAIFLALK